MFKHNFHKASNDSEIPTKPVKVNCEFLTESLFSEFGRSLQ